MTAIKHLAEEAKVWVKRKNRKDEILRVVPDFDDSKVIFTYRLYYAFAAGNNCDLGCILFDLQGYWIYDGDVLSIEEQEQVGRFIINHGC